MNRGSRTHYKNDNNGWHNVCYSKYPDNILNLITCLNVFLSSILQNLDWFIDLHSCCLFVSQITLRLCTPSAITLLIDGMVERLPVITEGTGQRKYSTVDPPCDWPVNCPNACYNVLRVSAARILNPVTCRHQSFFDKVEDLLLTDNAKQDLQNNIFKLCL